jgi:hydroxymethylpyrimidine pyrophosphatase-like HAD family hydrolase/energy-coupling factor transporter ATP-binding protein EcfA2
MEWMKGSGKALCRSSDEKRLMRYLAIAADYDGTLARAGQIAPSTRRALEQLIQSGRKLILVTGRLLDDLLSVFPDVHLCEWVVAENGAVLYKPSTREQKLLGLPIPDEFVAMLHQRNLPVLSIGRSILATVRPHEVTVLETIRDLGLELQVIFNRDAVMVLPSGVNKATGLASALKEMGLSVHNVVGIGDSENDHALLNSCDYAVAVANALPALKATANWVTGGEDGQGVVELIEALIAHDLDVPHLRQTRRRLLLGTDGQGREVYVNAQGLNLLLAGSSGSGKSTLATGLLERLWQQGYQVCIIDPEGDYESLAEAIVLGNTQHGPTAAEILTTLERPGVSVVANLVGVPLQDRPAFFMGLLPALQELRAKYGRPHWILVDETHHLLPSEWQPPREGFTTELRGMIYITVHPEHVAKPVLDTVDTIVTLGEDPWGTIQRYCHAIHIPSPHFSRAELAPGEALLWPRGSQQVPLQFRITPCETDRRRHRRKYAEGELPVGRSFFFRGPKNVLNLKAHNLILFAHLAEGVDDATWLHHLRQGDYSRWIHESIKDSLLADEVHEIEEQSALSAEDSRGLVKAAIERRYTLPVGGE